jgi:type IV pilus assembly protein PilA
MNSKKCAGCGFVSSSSAQQCRSCGASLSGRSGYANQWRSAAAPGAQLKKGLAIASLVVGIISFLTFGFLSIGAILGIVLAIIAISKANRNPWEYGGKGIAITGLVLSITSAVIIVPVGMMAAIAIPNLLAARRAANEGSAIYTMRQLSIAESGYFSKYGKYGTADDLSVEGIITPGLVHGTKNGYLFTISVAQRDTEDPAGFEIVSVPMNYPNTGMRSFYIDESGVIRAGNNHGAPASKFDVPLNDDSSSDSRPSSSRYGAE